MRGVLDLQALDAALARACPVPGCTHAACGGLRLITSCHTRAGVDLYYLGAGVLEVRCHRCGGEVATLRLPRSSPII